LNGFCHDFQKDCKHYFRLLSRYEGFGDATTKNWGLGSVMPSMYDIDPGPAFPEVVRVVVEIPKGSSNKFEYDKELGAFRLDRVLYSPVHYPGDYGFIPGTLASDGDPLDVLTLVEEPTFTGCIVEVRPIGVLNMVDQKQNDQKIIAVLNRDPLYSQVHALDQIFSHLRRAIEHFFNIYKELEGRETSTLGWGDPIEARRIISESRKAYLARQNRVKPVSAASPTEWNSGGG
jgi:inorganic pyrophosphatase